MASSRPILLRRRPGRKAHTQGLKQGFKKINIVIFDDEEQAVSVTRSHVEAYFESKNRADFAFYEARNLDELDSLLGKLPTIDILFADIVFPDSPQSGIEAVAQRFPANCDTEIIYISGFIKQALEVYSTAHIYFLLKPIDDDKLAEALDIALMNQKKRAPHMLCVKAGQKKRLINPSSIVYLESNLRKVTVHCRGGISRETYAQLEDLVDQLPASFCRCHRSFAVNLACVKSLSDTSVELSDGTTLPVSRRRAKDTQAAMLSFVQSQLRVGN